ncbi:MAG: alkene reductase [Burkholderiaceae bacterium]|nr:alkene reductase [Burkholderiaceae bacterium]
MAPTNAVLADDVVRPTQVSLLDPIRLGPYTLPNRVVMAPMTRNRAPGETPTELSALYYAQRAGAGLIITESTAISPRGLGWPEAPGVYEDQHVKGWRLVTEAVHRSGGRIYLQLWHCGRSSHTLTQPNGALPIGPSALQSAGSVRTREGRLPLPVPRAATAADIAAVIEEYRMAARRTMEAGFDGVEVHAANGFLLDQFMKDSANVRTDAYGGSPANRCRLLFEVVMAVADVWGASRVGVRLSPTNPSNFVLSDRDPGALFAAALEGLTRLRVSFVDVVEGSSNALPALADLDWARYRACFGGVYIANNGYTKASGQQALRAGRADMVAFGRPYIANPDLVRRFELDAPLNAVVQETLYAKGALGYTDYACIEGPR